VPNHPGPAWERLGEMLRRRRIEMNTGYRNRQKFCRERGADYRIVSAIENAERGNFEPDTIAGAEVWYDLAPGAIGRALAGDELEPAQERAATVAETPPQPSVPVPEAGPDEIGADERQVWAEVADALGRHGPDVTGAQVFPASATEAGIWDTRKLRNRQEKVQFIAQLRSIASAHDPESRTG
jgi:hypothetical protein